MKRKFLLQYALLFSFCGPFCIYNFQVKAQNDKESQATPAQVQLDLYSKPTDIWDNLHFIITGNTNRQSKSLALGKNLHNPLNERNEGKIIPKLVNYDLIDSSSERNFMVTTGEAPLDENKPGNENPVPFKIEKIQQNYQREIIFPSDDEFPQEKEIELPLEGINPHQKEIIFPSDDVPPQERENESSSEGIHSHQKEIIFPSTNHTLIETNHESILPTPKNINIDSQSKSDKDASSPNDSNAYFNNGNAYEVQFQNSDNVSVTFGDYEYDHRNHDYQYYEYLDYGDYVTLDHHLLGPSVRKCCSARQYFNTDKVECMDVTGFQQFNEKVSGIVRNDLSPNITIIPGNLHSCPYSKNFPELKNVTSNATHVIITAGLLLDVNTNFIYDQKHYCLEILGHNDLDVHLTAVYCSFETGKISKIRKCCPLDQYFDVIASACVERPSSMLNYTALISAFVRQSVDLKPETALLDECTEGSDKHLVKIQDSYMYDDHLCLYPDHECYSIDNYCVEDVWENGQNELDRTAVVCKRISFNKCCDVGQVIIDEDCVWMTGKSLSPTNRQAKTLSPNIGFPEGAAGCDPYHFFSNDTEFTWSYDTEGNLIVQSDNHEVVSRRYCVDDIVNETDTVTIVYVCREDLQGIIPLAIKENKGVKEVGKCCPIGQYSYINGDKINCVPNHSNLDLQNSIFMREDNSTRLIYTSFPSCPGAGYHYYNLEYVESIEDYVQFDNYHNLYKYATTQACVDRRVLVQPEEYCIDFSVTSPDQNTYRRNSTNQSLRIKAIVCVKYLESIRRTHAEKGPLSIAFSILSSVALLATIIDLASIRVRKGLVTVKKMHTLAGRILISYVSSCFVGFLSLAISIIASERLTQHTAGCHTLAGILTFSLLASFFWNTSICLESLLLTLHVTLSENKRFLCHSLWAWGSAGLITAITLTIDAYRADLPCSVVQPKIGDYYCFFSDPNAQLLYFYFPIGLTLLANVVFLISAKLTRQSKLSRLEKGFGNMDKKMKGGGKSSGQDKPSQPSSGLRTHQTKNLWAESVRLVMWSGGTWMIEFVGFVLSRYVEPHQERWYDYLWYIPSGANFLRGIGIFVILVLTPENKNRMKRIFNQVTGTGRFLSRYSRANDNSTSGSQMNSTIKMTQRIPRNGKRNMSISSQTTTLSSARQSTRSDLRTTIQPHLIQSIDLERKACAKVDSSVGFPQFPKLNDNKRKPSLDNNRRPSLESNEGKDSKLLADRRLSSVSLISTDSDSLDVESEVIYRRKPQPPIAGTLARVSEEDPLDVLSLKHTSDSSTAI